MPTTRKRRNRGSTMTTHTLIVLGLGAGINHMPNDELKALWQEFGAQVTDHWQRTFGHAPSVASIALAEGW